MKNASSWFNRTSKANQPQELILDRSMLHESSPINLAQKVSEIGKSVLAQLGRSLIHSLTTSAEIRVWYHTDANNQTQWNVFNPYTGQVLRFGSEDDVRAWIERDRFF